MISTRRYFSIFSVFVNFPWISKITYPRNFYMDDCLLAAPSVDEDERLIEQVSTLLQHKEIFVSKGGSWMT